MFKLPFHPIKREFLYPVILFGACCSMLIATPLWAQDSQDNQDQVDNELVLEEVVVTGIRRSLDFAAGVKRESDAVVDALMAQDIGLFSDNNIGEALSRIPGVLLERDAGEGFRISIRGLGPRFVRTTVNGRTALSPAGGEYSGGEDARGFTYNLMPSEVVSKVTVLKSTQAKDIEGGIGGVVDLQTNRPVDFANKQETDLYLSGTARVTYHDLLDDYLPRFTGFINKKLGDNFGVYFGAVIDDADRIDNLSESQRLRTYDHDLKAGTYLNGDLLTENLDNQNYSIFSGVRYQGQEIYRDRRTYIAGAQWTKDNWDVNFDWTHGTEDETRDDKRWWTDAQFSRQDENRLTEVWVDFNDAAPDLTVPTLGTLYHHEWDGAFRNSMGASLYRLLPRTADIDVGGINAKWSDDKWTVSGDIGYAAQDTLRILERLRGRLNGGLDRFDDGTSGSYDISSGYPIMIIYDSFGQLVDPLDTSHQKLDLLERTITNEEASDLSARLDFSLELESGGGGKLMSLFNSMDFGLAWNEMQFARTFYQKQANVNDFDFSGVADVVVTDIMNHVKVPGFVHEFAILDIRDPKYDAFLGDPDGYYLDQNGTFDLTEETTAAYMQLNFSTEGRYPVRGNAGLRYVSTDQTNVGWVGVGVGDDFVPADPANPKVTTARTYSEWLPSFNMAMDLTETWVTRFAANKAFTRPDPIDMSSRLELNDLDEEGDLSGSGGNPNLEPYTTYSYDLSLEWYPEFGGSYGLGVFYKDLQGYIARGSSPEEVLVDGELLVYDIRRAVNTDGGTIKGIEVQFHTPLDFLPGFLQYFGISGSYTWVDAKMDAVVPERNVPISLRGTSDESGNLVVYWEKDRFGARVALNYRSDYLYQEAEDVDRFDEFTYGSTNVDLNLDYLIGKNMKLRFSANNLTDERRSRFWNTPTTWYSDERDNGRTYVLEFRISSH